MTFTPNMQNFLGAPPARLMVIGNGSIQCFFAYESPFLAPSANLVRCGAATRQLSRRPRRSAATANTARETVPNFISIAPSSYEHVANRRPQFHVPIMRHGRVNTV
jgi:hypothetical protein